MDPTRATRPLPYDDPPDTRAEHGISADMRAVVGPLSFWRIINIPFGTWVTALEHWQLTGHRGELRLGESLLRGPAIHDQHFGTCRIEVRLARRRLRPPLRMRLDIDHWSATSTALALIPCQRVRPSTAYFQAGRRLLDSLTCAVPESRLVQAGAILPRPRLLTQGSALSRIPPPPRRRLS